MENRLIFIAFFLFVLLSNNMLNFSNAFQPNVNFADGNLIYVDFYVESQCDYFQVFREFSKDHC